MKVYFIQVYKFPSELCNIKYQIRLVKFKFKWELTYNNCTQNTDNKRLEPRYVIYQSMPRSFERKSLSMYRITAADAPIYICIWVLAEASETQNHNKNQNRH